MREIKFRGKRVDSGEWIYGWYAGIPQPNIMFLNDNGEVDCAAVDHETVGQYIGLKDKNGKEIYEGDIVVVNNRLYFIEFEIGSFMLVIHSVKTDMYDEFVDCWNDNVYPLSQYFWNYDGQEDSMQGLEVIGNIHDNPELLQ